MGSAYYNEIDPYAAQWLRNLISANLIAPGFVDERSIVDVRPSDLVGYTQCHFFAGIGVWSHALRQAGWSDGRPVWTGSCPCQPFSAAGARMGLDDAHHLWPEWFRLIRECKPSVVFGEQVARALEWLDVVSADMEGADYSIGSIDSCAASVGAPHIRQRLYFVAESDCQRRQGVDPLLFPRGSQQDRPQVAGGCEAGELADAAGPRRGAWPAQRCECDQKIVALPTAGSVMGNTISAGPQGCDGPGDVELHGGTEPLRPTAAPSAVNGFWRNAIWIPCRDGKARAIEPGTLPLVDGAPARVGRLRAYGNCIVAPQAQAFISSYMKI